jgi:phage gp29-like protein
MKIKKSRAPGTENVSGTRVQNAIQYRFNPLPMLTPANLVRWHDQFKRGLLKEAAILWDEIEDTDDVCKIAAAKRKKSVSRHGYEIIAIDQTPRAKQHEATLTYFWDNCVASSAVDRNRRGGLPMLIRQMMDAAGKYYSVHEILFDWRGDGLTAEFIHAPLWLFENKTGRLRYLEKEGDYDGVDLKQGEWLVASGDGVMRSVAVAYMFKHFPLQDWLLLSERYGRPVHKGKAPGKPGDAVWDAVEEAVQNLHSGASIVIGEGVDIDTIDFSGVKANLPYPALVDRMDRAIAALWRGSDLGTLSRADGAGASLQGDETDLLEEDDAANITDALNEQIDRLVIKLVHGDATPLAWLRVNAGVNQDVSLDLQTDESLARIGFKEEDIDDVRRRYNRPSLKKAPPLQTVQPYSSAANERQEDPATEEARKLYAYAEKQDLQPVADRLLEILDSADDQALPAALKEFREKEIPAMIAKILDDPAAARVIEELQGAAIVNAWEQAEKKRQPRPTDQ